MFLPYALHGYQGQECIYSIINNILNPRRVPPSHLQHKYYIGTHCKCWILMTDAGIIHSPLKLFKRN